MAFENYLALVSQIYYRACNQMSELTLPNINMNDGKDLLKPEEDDSALIQIKRGAKPTRKSKSKLSIGAMSDIAGRSGQSYNSNNLRNTLSNIEIEKGGFEQENKQFPDLFSSVYTDTLDALISPIKVDNVFGN